MRRKSASTKPGAKALVVAKQIKAGAAKQKKSSK
jgi:hypothetical protein